jgi:hypothetical protein
MIDISINIIRPKKKKTQEGEKEEKKVYSQV